MSKPTATPSSGPESKPQVLTIATQFPAPGFPTRGLWTERMLRATLDHVRHEVIVPVPWLPPFIHSEQRRRHRLAPAGPQKGLITAHFPRTRHLDLRVFRSKEVDNFYPAVHKLARRLHHEDPIHLLHAHFIYPEGVLAARLGADFGIPVLVTEHANWLPWLAQDPRTHRQVMAALPHIAGVVAVSESSADTIRQVAGNAVPVEVIPNAVDDEVFTVQDPSLRDPDRIVCCAAVRRVKGLDILLRAMPSILKERPQARIEIVGDPFLPAYRREVHALKHLSAQLSLGRRVQFLGPLPPLKVAALMSRAAVVVLPSRRESFGNVLIEAMATGTPVVSTRCGGPESIVSAATGRLVAPEAPEEMARAILDVMNAPDSFVAAKMRHEAVSLYGMKATGTRLAALYQRIMQATGQASQAADSRGA